MTDPTVTGNETRDREEITCRQLVVLVTDYLDGALSDDDRAMFDAHLEKCEGCRRHLHQMRLTIESTGRLREDDLPADLRDRLLSAFQTWKLTAADPFS